MNIPLVMRDFHGKYLLTNSHAVLSPNKLTVVGITFRMKIERGNIAKGSPKRMIYSRTPSTPLFETYDFSVVINGFKDCGTIYEHRYLSPGVAQR